jgi:hypothetical protein
LAFLARVPAAAGTVNIHFGLTHPEPNQDELQLALLKTG